MNKKIQQSVEFYLKNQIHIEDCAKKYMILYNFHKNIGNIYNELPCRNVKQQEQKGVCEV